MLISLEQCQILLSEGMIEKILDLFKQYNCSNIRLYAPQFSGEDGKINFYVEAHDDIDLCTISRLRNVLKEALEREDVNLSVDSLIDPDLKPFIQEHMIPFGRSSLEELYALLKGIDIKRQKATDGKTYVTIEFAPSFSDNTIDKLITLIKNYDDTTEEKIHDKSDEKQFQHKPYSSRIF